MVFSMASSAAALPDEALNGYAEVLGALELAPWSGQPQHEATRTGRCGGGCSDR